MKHDGLRPEPTKSQPMTKQKVDEEHVKKNKKRAMGITAKK